MNPGALISFEVNFRYKKNEAVLIFVGRFSYPVSPADQ